MSDTEARNQLKVSTRVLYDEFIRQNIVVDILDSSSSLLEYTNKSGTKHFLFSTCSDKSSATGMIIASSKVRTTVVAQRMNIPTPDQIICRDIREARKFLSNHRQIVVKPVLGSGGAGVSTNIKTIEELDRSYTYAKSHSNTIVVQQHIIGDDVRLLVVGGVFRSAVIRQPAYVVGDGILSIEELISATNADSSRNDDSKSSLMHISASAARRYLGDEVHAVAASGTKTRVVGPANVSLGGSLHQATHLVSAEMIKHAEAISKKLGLGICGVDMIWNRTVNSHYLIEVNATPGIDIHDDPFSGTSSDVVQEYVQWLIN